MFVSPDEFLRAQAAGGDGPGAGGTPKENVGEEEGNCLVTSSSRDSEGSGSGSQGSRLSRPRVRAGVATERQEN
jgi:hypothetical protein